MSALRQERPFAADQISRDYIFESAQARNFVTTGIAREFSRDGFSRLWLHQTRVCVHSTATISPLRSACRTSKLDRFSSDIVEKIEILSPNVTCLSAIQNCFAHAV
jgi:hypothetical protein